jgi:hypothetical protein
MHFIELILGCCISLHPVLADELLDGVDVEGRVDGVPDARDLQVGASLDGVPDGMGLLRFDHDVLRAVDHQRGDLDLVDPVAQVEGVHGLHLLQQLGRVLEALRGGDLHALLGQSGEERLGEAERCDHDVDRLRGAYALLGEPGRVLHEVG